LKVECFGGRAIPQQDKLRVLANLLNVEPHYLRFGKPANAKAQEKRVGAHSETISPQDRALIGALLALPAAHRKLVGELIKALASSG
jgi:hypothetical protein